MALAIPFFSLYCLLQLLCSPLLWCSFELSDSTAFLLVYLLGFFFDAADGPGTLLLPENMATSKRELLLYDISQHFFFLSFFINIAANHGSCELQWVARLLALYFLIGWLGRLFGCAAFHTICFKTDCLYHDLGKKTLRLLIKGGGLLLIIGQLHEGLDSGLISLCDRWVDVAGSFESQGVILLTTGLAVCYGAFLAHWAAPNFSFFDETGVP